MATKPKGRIPPDIQMEFLTENFAEQLDAGQVSDALVLQTTLPSLISPRGQSIRIDRCV